MRKAISRLGAIILGLMVVPILIGGASNGGYVSSQQLDQTSNRDSKTEIPKIAGKDYVFDIPEGVDLLNKLKNNVAYVMSLSEADVLALVPKQSGIFFTACPNCDVATQDQGQFLWDPRNPGKIVCKNCGAEFPDNPKYPDTGVTVVPGPDGPQRYPYYERPSDKYRFYFRARADAYARDYMASVCRDLGLLYRITGDEAAARKASIILVRFAEVYPGWAYHFDYPFKQKLFSPGNKNRIPGISPYRTAKWTWWAYMDVPTDLLMAYDSVRHWPGLASLDKGRAVDKIQKDLFSSMVDFVLGFPESYNNMSPTMWRSVILAGRAIGRPDYIDEALSRFDRFTQDYFRYDGHWMETSPSYCSQVLNGLNGVMDALSHGTNDESTSNLLSARMDSVRSRCEKILWSLEAPRFPDGRFLPLNDTWSENRLKPRDTMQPALLPGLGVAVLGCGDKDNQIHTYLNFSSGEAHKHYDALSIGLFTFGKELLPDIGYTHTKYRPWSICTVAHNTVVVNGRDSSIDKAFIGNKLRSFFADPGGFQVAEAESDSAYPGITSRYRRTLLLVGISARDAYIVDIFQVFGGDQHDWVLHGSDDEDSIANVKGAELTAYTGTLLNAGVVFKPPVAESSDIGPYGGYGFIHTLMSGTAGSQLSVEFRLAANTRIGTRTIMDIEPGTTVFLGQAPSIRNAKESDSSLAKFNSPFFCARRTGSNLRSTFVAIHEPLNGDTKIVSVTVDRQKAGLVITINRGPEGTDIVFSAFDDSMELNTKDLAFSGRFGLARAREGKASLLWMIGGTYLRANSETITGQKPEWQGRVKGVLRQRSGNAGGAFDVSDNIQLPEMSSLRCLKITHADGSTQAYTLVRVEHLLDGFRLYVREDPGFEIDDVNKTTRLVCYPQRTIAGNDNEYELLSDTKSEASK